MNIKDPEDNADKLIKACANKIIGIVFTVFILIGIILSICYELDWISYEPPLKPQGGSEVTGKSFNDTGINSVDWKAKKVENYFQRGGNYLDEGKYEQAIWNFGRALKLNPEFAEAYNRRGFAYYFSDKLDLAMEDFNRAIELNPGFFEAYGNRGRVYHMQGQTGLALKDFNKAIELNPEYSEAYTSRAGLYLHEDNEKAIRDYNKALELNPKDCRAYYNKGIACEKLAKYEEAIESYQKFIEYAEGLDKKAIPYANEEIEDLQKKTDSSSSE